MPSLSRFLVVVPTHRPHLACEAIAKLKASLTYPTEFHVLDGSISKVNAINESLKTIVDVDRHDIYVTVDDDVLLPENWQHFLACAFDRVANLGICGIDLDGTPQGIDVMANAMRAPRKQIRDILFRDTTFHQNVAGACMAMPVRIAKRIGPYPYEKDGRKHFTDEDGWRCHQCRTLGHRYGYVTNPNGSVELLTYDDDPAYVIQKQKDMDDWENNPSWSQRRSL